MFFIGRIFNAIDEFLTLCVHYVDERIITGKFVGDIFYQLDKLIDFIYKYVRKAYFIITSSNPYQLLKNAFIILWELLMKVSLFKLIASMIQDALKIIITCYSEIFIVFALTFPSSILLLNWFQTHVATFLIALIPVLLLDIFLVSALYYFIDHRELGENITLWKSMHIIFHRFPSVSLPIITESALILESSIAFFLIALFASYLFEIFQVSWSDSILYWFTIIFSGSLILIGIFILNLISYQTSFLVLLDHIPFQEALKRSTSYLKHYLPHFIFFYLLFYLFSAIVTWRALLSYLYLGLTLGIFSTIACGIFLSFLLRRRFSLKMPAKETLQNNNQKVHPVFITIIIFGLINYILVAFLLMKEYQPILAFIQQQQDNFLASQQVKQFSNKTYGYSLEYPQNWSVYTWNEQSITFYNNYTGTLSGGTWMTINVSSYNTSLFPKLYIASPGVAAYDIQTKDIITKVSNLTIQGYTALSYTFVKHTLPYPQYETHYLIHKDDKVYDIAFISVTNDVASYNSDLFQKIISSLRFTQ